MADWLYGTVKFLHVLFAVQWIGGGLLNVAVLQKVLGEATPSTRREFMGRLFPALSKYFNVVGGLTILSGLLLVSLHPNGWSNLGATAWGKMILTGIIASLFTLYLLNFAIRPTFKAVQKIMTGLEEGAPPPTGLRFLLARIRVTSILNVVLLVGTLAAMVGANLLFFGP